MEALFPTRWSKDRPPSIEAFVDRFPDDFACAEYLARRRWPHGFVCPVCRGTKGWRLEAKAWTWECATVVDDADGGRRRCGHQTSVTAGTVMQSSHVPLRKWFLAAYLVTTHSNGISALQLQSKLGLGSYKSAWLLLQKLRRAMVNPDRTQLEDTVEVDETSVTYRKKDDPVTGGQGRSTVGKMFIIGAVELSEGKYPCRIRLKRIPEISGAAIRPFVIENVAPGATFITDDNSCYNGIPDRTHIAKNLSAPNALPAHIVLRWVHRVFSNMQRWAMGTYHGLREKHVDAYLNEFVFRWNRRRLFASAIDSLLGIGFNVGPKRYRDIVGDTLEWKRAHRKAILKMLGPNKRRIVLDLAFYYRVNAMEILEDLAFWYERLKDEDRAAMEAFRWETSGVPELEPPHRYGRKTPERPMLARRRPGEERLTGRRYAKPDRSVPRIVVGKQMAVNNSAPVVAG